MARFYRCVPLCALVALSCVFLVSCVASLGPGYTIKSQEIRVRFVPASEPRIRVETEYNLQNTGNKAIETLEMRLPGRRFRLTAKQFLWDGAELTPAQLKWNPRVSVVQLPERWVISARHTVRINFEFMPPDTDSSGPSFSSDAFFLAAGNWNPELLPSEGFLGFGGVPPDQWLLSVTVPASFVVHSSGSKVKVTQSPAEQTVRATQTIKDHAPFVVAGRYATSQIAGGKGQIQLWTRSKQETSSLKNAGDEIAKTVNIYNSTFGTSTATEGPLWIVECPLASNCFTNLSPTTEMLLGERAPSAEMISSDTAVVDITGGIPKLGAAVAPSLAASWLGYGQNPGFYDQTPPLSALPLFAAALGREALEGPEYRTETIRRALRLIPKNPEPNAKAGSAKTQETPDVVRAKSMLFFYGLQDYFGKEAFRKALTEMLAARRGRGFNINDLIAVLWDDTGKNAAEFVRIWMKRPGVPEDFRARYEGDSAITAVSQEDVQ